MSTSDDLHQKIISTEQELYERARRYVREREMLANGGAMPIAEAAEDLARYARRYVKAFRAHERAAEIPVFDAPDNDNDPVTYSAEFLASERGQW